MGAPMKQYLAVVNSDRVNKYKMLFPVSSLESGLANSWDMGIPMHLGHDLHRLVAWSRGLGIHLEPGLARLTAICFMPESDAEGEQLCALANRHRAERIREAVEPHLEELQRRLGLYLSPQYRPANPDCAAFRDSGLATRAFPDLFAERDKDGLVPANHLKAIAAGVFECDGLLLFAHPYFRRSYSRLNSLNTPFLSRFYAMRGRAGLDVRMALDADLVGLAHTFNEHIELEYWWGPKFSDDLEGIPIPSIARHVATDTERRFHGISRTEFWWYGQDEARSFECEELQDLPAEAISDGVFGCRFIHSRLDPKTGTPVHLDGAVRMYEEEAMVRRLDQTLHQAGRHSQYTKLWRIDGPLAVMDWKELVTHYYRDNRLVGEYFGGVDESGHAAPALIEHKEPDESLTTYVPCEMQKGDGIRLHIAYHPKEEGQRAARSVLALDWLTRGEEQYKYVEIQAVDLVKLVRRGGRNIEFPADIARFAFEDLIFNFPLVMHAGPDGLVLAEETLSAMQILCRSWAENGDDRLVAFTIGIEYGDRDVYFSFAGHVTDFQEWWEAHIFRFPASTSQFGSWIEEVYASFLPGWRTADNQPTLAAMMQKSGVLAFKRQFLDPREYPLRLNAHERGVSGELRIPVEKETLCALVTSGTMCVKPCFIATATECSRCKDRYEDCACCAFLEDGVQQVMQQFDFVGAFWTTRPA
jgi:hypothetical protein